MDSNKPAQNIQDSFLNTARKERLSITIYLLSGVKLTGRIRSFDKYSVVLEANGQEQLIFKHAISTVVMGRVAPSSHGPHVAHSEKPAVSVGAAPSAISARASGSEGQGLFRLSSSTSKKSRKVAGRRGAAPVRAELAPKAKHEGSDQERAFLVGIDVRSRRAKGAVTAQGQAAREAASGAVTAKTAVGAKGNGHKPLIPEFDADESLAELRTLAGSAGAKVVGEILQRRDRPDPATLIGAGKLEEIAGAAASVDADVLLFDHDLSPSQQRNIEKIVQRRVIDRTQLIL